MNSDVRLQLPAYFFVVRMPIEIHQPAARDECSLNALPKNRSVVSRCARALLLKSVLISANLRQKEVFLRDPLRFSVPAFGFVFAVSRDIKLHGSAVAG
jgi:hypothetical protein